MMLTEFLLVVLFVVLVYRYWFEELKRPFRFPPGPSWVPFIGNGPELRKMARTLGGQHLAFIALARQFNTDVVGLKLGKERVVCVCSYSSVRQVLTSDAYQGRPDNFFFRLRCLGKRKGVTATDGEVWKEQRTFLVSHLRALGFGKTLMEGMVKKEVAALIDTIDKSEDNVVDLSVVLPPSILTILWQLTSGQDLKGNSRIAVLLQLLNRRTKAFDMSGGLLNQYPWLRFVAPERTGYNLLKSVNMQIKEFITEAISAHKTEWTDGRNDDIIHSYLTEMKKLKTDTTNFDEEQLTVVCLDILIAGSTTTSNTIEFAFLAMILFPEVQEKVRRCLDAEFKPDEEIVYCDRLRVPYIEAVLLECQRWFPVVPLAGPRRAVDRAQLEDFIIPKNTTIFLNLHAVHHDKDFWKDPQTFRPERFLDEKGALTRQDRILTFGLGKRKCLGDALAKACIFLFFVQVLRRYRIGHDETLGQPTGKQTPGITLSPEKYRAKFVARMC